MASGWIKIHRQLQDSWIWKTNTPFDERSAWVDLLLSANHIDNKILFNGELITIKRGQFLTSIRKLSERWKWSINKVYRFLKLLEGDGMIRRESDSSRTLITVVNYEIYQGAGYTDENSGRNTSETAADTGSETKQEEKKEKMEEGKKKERASAGRSSPPPEPMVYDPLDEKLNQAIADFVEYRKSIKAPMTEHAVDLMLKKLQNLTADNNEKIQILEQSMINGWKGIFPLKEETGKNGRKKDEKSFYEIAEKTHGEDGSDIF